MKLPIDSIRLDGGTQPRTGINAATVSEYAELVMAGKPFKSDPVVFFDGVDYWLADGFHRVHGSRQAGKFEIVVDLRQGTQRDAIKFSLSANADHGLPRSYEDKRKVVRTALEDPEWGKWSSRDIAVLCAVSHTFVLDMREALSPKAKPAPRVEPESTGSASTSGASGGSASSPAHAGSASSAKPSEPPAPPPAAPETGSASSQDDAGPSADEMLDELQREVEQLTAQVNSLKAEDKGAEILKLSKLVAHAQREQSAAMETAAKAQQREKWSARQLARCGKAVGQNDPDKIAPAVEAFVRAHQKVKA